MPKDRPKGAGFNSNQNPIMNPIMNHNTQSPDVQAIILTEFLSEIGKVLPTITGTEHRAMVIHAQSLFGALLYSILMGKGFTVLEDTFQKVIETLRCCGIAPAGWPQPPGPEALLRTRAVFLQGWGGTDGTGGKKR